MAQPSGHRLAEWHRADDEQSIAKAINALRAPTISVTTGGIGPTQMTHVDSIAAALGVPVVVHLRRGVS